MFKKALMVMGGIEILSLLAFVYQSLSLPLLLVVGVLTLWLSLKNLQYGIYILFGELFVGSRGRLLEYEFISLRMVVFGAVFLAWLYKHVILRADLRQPEGSRDSSPRWGGTQNDNLGSSYWVLLLVIVAGAVYGYFGGYGLKNVFLDVNGYLYLAILPAVLAGIRSREAIENLFKILAAAIVIIAAKTLILFVWFTYGFPGVATAYHWIIEREIGEITGIVGSASRIFLASQFWALVGVFVFLFKTKKGEERRGEPPLHPSSRADESARYGAGLPLRTGEKGGVLWRWLVISAAMLAVILGLSRSFWLGAIAGAFFFAGVWLFKLRWGVGKLGRLAGVIILIAVLEIGGLYLLSRGSVLSESVASRGVNPASEAAGSARLLLLPELLKGIAKAPFIGSGFGKELTYKSYLPDRITLENPEGEIRSFALEWGYLDIMLKVGLIGLIVYLLFIARIFQQGWSKIQIPNTKYQILGTLSGLVALLILNLTTPYLNHPLGIGYLILALLSFRNMNDSVILKADLRRPEGSL